jgi:hypothetical protein
LIDKAVRETLLGRARNRLQINITINITDVNCGEAL